VNDPDAPEGSYFDFPTGSDAAPSNDLVEPADLGNNATFYNDGYTIGLPYYRTEGGAHENSASAYGTFDQGGNVWEWTEAVIGESSRGLRGGTFYSADYTLSAASRGRGSPTHEFHGFGFRVSGAPEPATMAILAVGGAAMLMRRRRVRR